MKLHEYQAKDLFDSASIATPPRVLIDDVKQLDEALKTIQLPCVLKAQVLRGGRGKAGLIKFVKTLDEAQAAAEVLFNHPDKIQRVLVEQAVDFTQELYVSITVDANAASGLLIVSNEGGVDIEILATEQPEKLIQKRFDLQEGLMPFQASEIAYRLGFDKAQAKPFIKLLLALYKVFAKHDAELVEINPLFITKTGELVAGDGKVSIDDNALFRQSQFEKGLDDYKTEAEYEAAQEGIPFIEFDGDISLMCAGAGLTTTVYDLVNYEGGSVANYLEFGGPNYKKALKAMEICLKVPSKVILIVTFGTIARADVMAEGIVDAINRLKPDRPIVTCIRGTNEEGATKTLKEAGLEPLFDTEEAVKKAVALAKGDAR